MFAATPLTEVWPYVVVLASMLTFVIVALRRWPAAGFAACWYFLILAPTSSIIPVVGQPMAENRLYLPLAGVMAFAVLGAFTLAGRRSLPVFAVVAAGLGLASAQRNQDYRSEPGLWSDTVAKRPNNERAHNNLGLVWSKMPGRLNDAIAQYETALRLKPDYEEAHTNLGVALANLPGRLHDAIAEFEAALRLQPDDFEAHSNLGVALANLPGRLDDAIAQYEAALRLQPDHAEVHNNLGVALAQTPGRLHDAIAELEAAVRLNPEDARGWHNLGRSRFQLGDFPRAAAAFREELRLKPDDPAAQQALAATLQQAAGH
jgi:tetratricopeptide (TPR) repeat protein